ncbi:MAG: hypothetical protein KDB03_24805 [Planctomycetales bacterium]|nr:hypothetical protein [Planctomycetales bacterium]
MNKPRSFVPWDFSTRDIWTFLLAFVGISAISVVEGLLLDSLPRFGVGFLFGFGIGFCVAVFSLRTISIEDIARLPMPSDQVREMCNDPACVFPSPLFTQAVKIYRDETGVTLSGATAVLKKHIENRRMDG